MVRFRGCFGFRFASGFWLYKKFECDDIKRSNSRKGAETQRFKVLSFGGFRLG
jgi:hypothetical protein